MPTPQNGQTHSNNSLAILSVFDHFVGLALIELKIDVSVDLYKH